MAKAKAKSATRKVKAPKYQSFKLNKKIKHASTASLPGAIKLTRRAFATLRSRWKLFAGMVLVYALLTIVIVSGFGIGSDIGGLKAEIEDSTGGVGGLATGLTVFQYLLFSGNSPSSESAGVYQMVIFVVFSLASIWALRQVVADKPTTVKQSFYNGMYPLIPFLLVVFVLLLQLLPMMIGNFLYGLVVGGGIATEMIEKVVWAILAGLLTLLSLYMVSSSIFAVYIVTLPGMQPMKALRSAREIVRHRRLLVMRKVLALPLVMLLLLAAIMVPLIILAAPVAEVVFFIFSMAILLIAHSYLYTLYRELL